MHYQQQHQYEEQQYSFIDLKHLEMLQTQKEKKNIYLPEELQHVADTK